MENRRFFLIAIFGVLLFLTYQAWQKDHPKTLPASVPATAITASDAITAPASQDALPVPAAAGVPGAAPEATPVVVADAGRVQVVTDTLRLEISLAGGDLRRVELIGYPVSKARPDVDLALLDEQDPHFFVIQSGLAAKDRPLVTPATVFTAPQARYELAPGADSLEVPLESIGADGLTVRKRYRFSRGSYQIELVQGLVNNSAAPKHAPAARVPLSLALSHKGRDDQSLSPLVGERLERGGARKLMGNILRNRTARAPPPASRPAVSDSAARPLRAPRAAARRRAASASPPCRCRGSAPSPARRGWR